MNRSVSGDGATRFMVALCAIGSLGAHGGVCIIKGLAVSHDGTWRKAISLPDGL